MHRGVNIKAASADRLQSRLAHGDPIGFLKMFDVRFSSAQRAQDVEFHVIRMLVEIGVDHPFVRLGWVRLICDQHRLIDAVRKQVVSIGDGFSLNSGAREGNAPTQLEALSLSMRSSRPMRPRLA